MEPIRIERGLRERLRNLMGRRSEAVVVALVVAAATVASAALVAGHRPDVIAPPATENASRSAPGAAAPSPSPSLLVDVSGAVRRPGVYELVQGARIQDAVDQAGGPTRRADLSALNLAQPVIDGQKIDVPTHGEAPVAAIPGASVAPGTTPAPGQTVSLNSADEPTLETIPGVGPVTAQKIIDYRTTHGGFTSIDELLDIDGIGPATLEDIRPYVSL